MTHYICKGDNCATLSNKPSVCLSKECAYRYKLLEECPCDGKEHCHEHGVVTGKVQRHAHKGHVLDNIRFGVAVGIGLGSILLALGLFAKVGWGSVLVETLSTWFLGYNTSVYGLSAGFFWGIVNGFLLGVVTSFFYNKLKDFSLTH